MTNFNNLKACWCQFEIGELSSLKSFVVENKKDIQTKWAVDCCSDIDLESIFLLSDVIMMVFASKFNTRLSGKLSVVTSSFIWL